MKRQGEIEKVFAQRANEVRNPLSGQELRDEALRVLAEIRRMKLGCAVTALREITDVYY